MEKIGEQAFSECSGLTSVTLPAELTNIESGAFERCSKLHSIVIPEAVTNIDDLAFFGCKALASVRLPAGLKSIGISSFEGCEELTSIALPHSVTHIGSRAFYGCSIKELYFGGNLEPGALEGVHTLTDVTIGSQVTDASGISWSDCDSLTTLRVLSTNPPAVGKFSKKQYMNVKVYVPQGTLTLYQAADGWKDFWNLQEVPYTGISFVDTAPKFSVKAEDGHIVVEDAMGCVSVYDVDGQLIRSAEMDGGRIELDVPDRGVYIVRSGGVTVKITI